MRNDYRVGVWSTGLTREQVVASYFARRTFATEDKNAWISMKFNNAEMGSRLNAGTYQIEMNFGDRDGENFKSVKLVKRGVVIKEFTVENNQPIFHEVEAVLDDFFYIIAEQEDGDVLLGSPIWVVP